VTPHEPPPEPLPSAEAGTAADTSGEPAQVWYRTPWAMGAGILIVGLLAGVVWYVIKRRYDDVMEGLEEFEEEEDGEEEEEDDEEEETTVRRRRK
jgi:flagellar biosynthesis/type III secretory pathway M-ring protein FliF/YscJ